MKIIENSILPFRGFKVLNLFGFLFVRKGTKLSTKQLVHEAIHTEQMHEMFYLFFYLWYIIEWIVRLFMKGNAYRNISFEREAFVNEQFSQYIFTREPYAWIRYLKNKN